MSTGDKIIGWLLALAGTTVYLLTLAPTVSFWDCGEFIATAHGLQIGHPPGAPFYQLVAHIFTLFAPTPQDVAWCCNALSATCGGLTVAMLYWTMRLLDSGSHGIAGHITPITASLCYLFCDTAWFSAVESEVYSMAMLMASTMVYASLRWYRSTNSDRSRWIVLTALLCGLSTCVHLLCLLTLPAVLLLVAVRYRKERTQCGKSSSYIRRYVLPTSSLCIVAFLIGLTPYLIIPIRASANPPINCGDPSTGEAFMSYVRRDQYAHAPLYPRIWRESPYADSWSGGRNDIVGNVTYYVSYQFTYMYLRYLLWNFSGRYNHQQGYGSLQNGQFITGVGFLDRMLVGTAVAPPDTMSTGGRSRYYLLPLMLGLLGLCNPPRHSRTAGWMVALLFLMGGPVLNIYLNHPVYEPRERDYAYILSFYAFAIWIGWGAAALAGWISKGKQSREVAIASATLCIPLLMVYQNWSSHDRSHRYVARDTAHNILQCCAPHSHLITYGDNDTFPLWYLQQVEHGGANVEIHNFNLMGSTQRFFQLLQQATEEKKPVFFTHYAKQALGTLFPTRWKQTGFVYLLSETPTDSIDATVSYERMMQCSWHISPGRYIEETEERFLQQWWKDILATSNALTIIQRKDLAARLIQKNLDEISPTCLHNPQLTYDIMTHCREIGLHEQYITLHTHLTQSISEELRYYKSLSPADQSLLHLSIDVRRQIADSLATR